jgi:hypothetical protein
MPIHRFLIMQPNKFVSYPWIKLEAVSTWRQDKNSFMKVFTREGVTKRKTMILNKDSINLSLSSQHMIPSEMSRRKTQCLTKKHTQQLHDVDFTNYFDGYPNL